MRSRSAHFPVARGGHFVRYSSQIRYSRHRYSNRSLYARSYLALIDSPTPTAPHVPFWQTLLFHIPVTKTEMNAIYRLFYKDGGAIFHEGFFSHSIKD